MKPVPCPRCKVTPALDERQYKPSERFPNGRVGYYLGCECGFKPHTFRSTPEASAARWNEAVADFREAIGPRPVVAFPRDGGRSLPRCPRCRLLLDADGLCTDCPGDPARLRRLTMERPGAEGCLAGNFQVLKR